MAHKIDREKCIDCGLCQGECPVNAINEGEGARVIDPKICIDCGACKAICPTEAISD